MVAEYERAKILERSRRGKRHAALAGSVNVFSTAPYGYRYVGKRDGGGVARFEIVEEQAQVVRQIFDLVGRDRLSIGEVCRRLYQRKCPRSEEHTSELQSRQYLVCRLLLEKKKMTERKPYP